MLTVCSNRPAAADEFDEVAMGEEAAATDSSCASSVILWSSVVVWVLARRLLLSCAPTSIFLWKNVHA